MPDVTINAPEVATKELALQHNVASSERWLRVSSNMLNLFGFEPGAHFERRVLGHGCGFELALTCRRDAIKVHRRTYKHRRNNPFETVIDIRGQSFINSAVPVGADRVHYTFRNGVIVGRPVYDRTFHIRKAIRDPKTPLEAFIGLSSGIDAISFGPGGAGFGLQGLLEYRPQEARDGARDKTETGIMTAMANHAFRFVFNEDIYRVDFGQLAETLKGQPRVAVLVLSPQCDDFTQIKARSLREASIASLDTTVDMGYECLKLIETINPAVVMIENVPGFAKSPIWEIMELKLRRWGYHVTADVRDARDFGGITSRRRFLAVASVFPGYEAPAGNSVPQPGCVWQLIEDQLPFLRDVTHTSAMQGGLATGRARLITKDSAYAPTVTKSEAHGAKDAIRIVTPDGRYFAPNETIFRRLQGIPDSFDLGAVSQEVATEQIGQSVDIKMHDSYAHSIFAHLSVNRGAALAPQAVSVKLPRCATPSEEVVEGQLALGIT
jgi:DNA (cytosine-5)-methyltransferase 1